MTSTMRLGARAKPLGRAVLQRLGGGLDGDVRHDLGDSPAGNVDVSGSPPASEMTSGRSVIAMRSRMAEDFMPARALGEQPCVALEVVALCAHHADPFVTGSPRALAVGHHAPRTGLTQ